MLLPLGPTSLQQHESHKPIKTCIVILVSITRIVRIMFSVSSFRPFSALLHRGHASTAWPNRTTQTVATLIAPSWKIATYSSVPATTAAMPNISTRVLMRKRSRQALAMRLVHCRLTQFAPLEPLSHCQCAHFTTHVWRKINTVRETSGDSSKPMRKNPGRCMGLQLPPEHQIVHWKLRKLQKVPGKVVIPESMINRSMCSLLFHNTGCCRRNQPGGPYRKRRVAKI